MSPQFPTLVLSYFTAVQDLDLAKEHFAYSYLLQLLSALYTTAQIADSIKLYHSLIGENPFALYAARYFDAHVEELHTVSNRIFHSTSRSTILHVAPAN